MGSSAYANRCVTFDGTNEYATASGSSALSKEYTDKWSVSFWIATVAVTGYFLGKMDATTQYRGWGIGCASGSKFIVVIRSDSSLGKYLRVEFPALNGLWAHFVVTYAGTGVASGLKGYLNGVEQTAEGVVDALAGGTIVNAVNFWLGGAASTSPGWFAPTSQTQVSIYPRVLTQAEITWLYNSGVPRPVNDPGAPSDIEAWFKTGVGDTHPTLLDSSGRVAWPTIPDRSGSGYNGTATNMESTDIVLDTPGGVHSVKCLEFGGVDEYVDCGNVLGFETNLPFSVSFWVKQTLSAGAFVISKTAVGVPGGWQIYIAGSVGIELINSWPSTWLSAGSTFTGLNDGNWHHVVIAWDGNATPGAAGVKIWIDGSPNTTSIGADTLGTSSIANGGNFNMGRRQMTPSSDLYVGRLDEVAVYNKVLSDSEVTWIRNGGSPRDPRLAGAPSGLVGYWPLGEGTGTPVGNLTMTNMEAEDFLNDGPDFFRDHLVTDADVDILSEDEHENLFANGGGGPAPPVTVTYYKLRVRDSLAGPPTVYREWESTSYLSSPPPPDPIGVWIERTILATWVI